MFVSMTTQSSPPLERAGSSGSSRDHRAPGEDQTVWMGMVLNSRVGDGDGHHSSTRWEAWGHPRCVSYLWGCHEH